jgi:membrane fusion protein, multidrug efflux system
MSYRICHLALLVSMTVSCSSKQESANPDAAGTKSESNKSSRGGRQALTFAADVMSVEAKPVTYVVSAPGRIEAFERVQVTARVAGAVDRVGFAEGQQVKRGQVLVVIDSARYQATVDSAQAAVDKARAAQSDAEAMVNRRQGAAAEHPGLIPGEEIATYRTKTLTAKADTQVAEQALKTAQLNLRDSSVRAPMDGVIQTRTVETGQYVQAGYLMATLLRKDPMLLRFEVEVADALRIKPGMVAGFTMRETQTQFSAKITLVAAAADATSHMVPITAELTDKEHKYWLRPGSFCDVTVDLERGQRVAPTIPRSAARATDHGYVAYVVEGDVAKERSVTLGMNTKDGWIEVRSGINAGDSLVVRGGEALTDGAKVKANRVTAAAFAASGGTGAPSAAAMPEPSASSDGAPPGTRKPKGKPSALPSSEAQP